MSASHLIGAIAFALLATACSKQGEGERCDPNSGSLDCESGLICRSADQLNITEQARGVALCCPPVGVAPSVNACSAGADLPPDPLQDAAVPATPAAPTDGGV